MFKAEIDRFLISNGIKGYVVKVGSGVEHYGIHSVTISLNGTADLMGQMASLFSCILCSHKRNIH